MQKSDHHIGDLHAGVVDVVLHVDFLPGSAQQAHERVAENGVAQVSDVRGLVGIDAGVLDQNLARGDCRRSASDRRQGRPPQARVDPRVDVSGAGDFQLLEAFDRTNAGDDLFGNLARRLAQLLRELESSGRAYSPSSTLGGCSMTMAGEITP